MSAEAEVKALRKVSRFAMTLIAIGALTVLYAIGTFSRTAALILGGLLLVALGVAALIGLSDEEAKLKAKLAREMKQ